MYRVEVATLLALRDKLGIGWPYMFIETNFKVLYMIKQILS